MIKNILITGGTGLIGSKIAEKCAEKKYNVGILSRKKPKNSKYISFLWDYEKNFIEPEAIEFADIIINLAGENINGKKWTKNQKKLIIESRTKTTQLIYDALKNANKKIHLFVSASAIGFYGAKTGKDILTENSPAGNDFLADVVIKWENKVDKIAELSDRVVKYRIGVVLSHDGGALPQIMKIVNKGLAASLGSGQQYMPWIGINDLSRIFLYSIENQEINGT